jgi:hypothetical protein
MSDGAEREPAIWLLAPDILAADALLLRLRPSMAKIVLRKGDRRVEVWIGDRGTHSERVAEAVQAIIWWVDAEQIPVLTARIWGVDQTFVAEQPSS